MKRSKGVVVLFYPSHLNDVFEMRKLIADNLQKAIANDCVHTVICPDPKIVQNSESLFSEPCVSYSFYNKTFSVIPEIDYCKMMYLYSMVKRQKHLTKYLLSPNKNIYTILLC
jgi:hypothetical protein